MCESPKAKAPKPRPRSVQLNFVLGRTNTPTRSWRSVGHSDGLRTAHSFLSIGHDVLGVESSAFVEVGISVASVSANASITANVFNRALYGAFIGAL